MSVRLTKRETLRRLRQRHRAAKRAIWYESQGKPYLYGKDAIRAWALVGDLDREIQAGWRES